jgi:pSer/pThr/pTyr-binding forkhead associated (FHA) protein
MQPSQGLGPLPPLSGSGGSYANPSDPFGGGGDPFGGGGGDPFASVGQPMQQPLQSSGGYSVADSPFSAKVPNPLGGTQGPPIPQRAQTISPGGRIPTPGVGPLKPLGNLPIGPAGTPNNEPELEESHTRMAPAIGTGRPKFMITQLDGTNEGEFPLREGENLLGRGTGGVFAKDNLLSGRHATIIVQGQSVWVRDEGSRNGVYIRLPKQQHIELNDGDQFCIGRVILRFELAPTVDSTGLLHLVVGRDIDKEMFPYRVARTGLTLGRTRAELKFPKDGWVSGLHCQIVPHGPQVMLVDLGSANGTYIRIRAIRALAHQDALLMGQRIFHLNLS